MHPEYVRNSADNGMIRHLETSHKGITSQMKTVDKSMIRQLEIADKGMFRQLTTLMIKASLGNLRLQIKASLGTWGTADVLYCHVRCRAPAVSKMLLRERIAWFYVLQCIIYHVFEFRSDIFDISIRTLQ